MASESTNSGSVGWSAGTKARNAGCHISKWEVFLIPSPMHKFFSRMTVRRVECLLMGEKACAIDTTAEWSRDTELAALTEPENLERLRYQEI
jgi:hypothetical protein